MPYLLWLGKIDWLGVPDDEISRVQPGLQLGDGAVELRVLQQKE